MYGRRVRVKYSPRYRRRRAVYSGTRTSQAGYGGTTYKASRSKKWVRRNKRNILNTSVGSTTSTYGDNGNIEINTGAGVFPGTTIFVPYLNIESLDANNLDENANTVRIKGGAVKVFLAPTVSADSAAGQWMIRVHRVVSKYQCEAAALNTLSNDFDNMARSPFSSTTFRDNFHLLKTTETMLSDGSSLSLAGKIATRTFRIRELYNVPNADANTYPVGESWGPSIGGMIIQIFRIDQIDGLQTMKIHRNWSTTVADTNRFNQ